MRHARQARIFVPLAVAAAGAIGAAILAVSDPRAVAEAYLAAVLAWAMAPIGALGIVLAYYLIGGRWAVPLFGALAALCRTLPLTALSMLPVLIWPAGFYPWTEAFVRAGLAPDKAAYLSGGFFALRGLFYLAVLLILAVALARPRAMRARAAPMRAFAAIGLILYALAVSFAAIDWVLSLEPDFSSSAFGLIVLNDALLAGTAWAVWAAFRHAPQAGPVAPAGAILLALVVCWPYLAFMQYLVIWSADLSREIPYYLKRGEGAWPAVMAIVVLGQVVAPFFLLLPRGNRANPQMLAGIGLGIFAMRLLGTAWMAAPDFQSDGWPLAGALAAMFAAVGGVWIAVFLRDQGAVAPAGALTRRFGHG